MSKRAAFEFMCARVTAQFPKYPEAQLCASVVVQALYDLFYPGNTMAEKWDRDTALNYLAGDIPHADMWGVEADWIRSLIYAMRAGNDSRIKSRRDDHGKSRASKAGRSRLLSETVGYAGAKRNAATWLP